MERNRNERRKTGWFGLKSKNPVSALGQEFLSEKNLYSQKRADNTKEKDVVSGASESKVEDKYIKKAGSDKYGTDKKNILSKREDLALSWNMEEENPEKIVGLLLETDSQTRSERIRQHEKNAKISALFGIIDLIGKGIGAWSGISPEPAGWEMVNGELQKAEQLRKESKEAKEQEFQTEKEEVRKENIEREEEAEKKISGLEKDIREGSIPSKEKLNLAEEAFERKEAFAARREKPVLQGKSLRINRKSDAQEGQVVSNAEGKQVRLSPAQVTSLLIYAERHDLLDAYYRAKTDLQRRIALDMAIQGAYLHAEKENVQRQSGNK
ncbi:MAG TPA: hypothetical protein IAA79_05240 [Candidatus Avirikenella pullistercoris]|nr:hypothetical protein [Candidatus Avirikenella pullistercoris]